MTVSVAIGLKRRWLLVKAVRGTLGFALIGVAAACSVDDEDDEPCTATGKRASGSAAGLGWRQVDLAYVSAFVLVRGREAALVDCGLGSTVDEIEAVLGAAGTGWDRVRHVLITHAHGDHLGGLSEVRARAPRAALYAGAAEKEGPPFPYFPDAVAASDWSRARPVTDGEEVFGLHVVGTPGHTPATSPSSTPIRECSLPETLSPTPSAD
jgi:hypothetical protein